ncbi:MAG: hypothetical protein ACE5GB_11675 [Acidimicrobiales bacterium]
MIRLIAAVAAITLLATACGGSAEDDFREQMGEVGFDDQTIDCIIGELDAAGLSVSDVSDSALGEADIPPAAQNAITSCLAGAALDDTGGGDTLTGGADGYGDDPTLDALYDECAAGDGEACDSLYFQSPIGSEYETYGNTCGERFEESPGLCAVAMG